MPSSGAAPRWLDAEQQRIWRSYLLGTSRLLERLDADLRRYGLDLPEYEILVVLSESPERKLRMSDLAAAIHLSRSRLTHTVSRMEKAGLVTRGTCSQDRRGVCAELTDSGFALLVSAAPDHVEAVRRYLVDVATPRDFAAVGRVFSAVSKAADSAKP